MSQTVTIVDYGMGNLFSVQRGFEVSGAKVKLTSDPVECLRAEKLIIPGVGAFYKAMEKLNEMNLTPAIREYAKTGQPIMGICLGMQLLFDISFEFGEQKGLGLIPGKVVAIPSESSDGQRNKIPFIGWSELEEGCDWSDSFMQNIEPGEPVYFVHSWMAQPIEKNHILAVTDYNGQKITAAVKKDNVMGTQFHPERSGPTGLKILDSFLEI